MGQAFWTGVRLPSSPPESSGTVKNDLHFSQSLFCAFFWNDSKWLTFIVISSGAAWGHGGEGI